MTSHKGENLATKDAGAKDSTCIDPLNITDHQSDIMNIVAGKICPEKVNVDQALLIGQRQ